jgi:ABC-type sugar transport system ATPase subunit
MRVAATSECFVQARGIAKHFSGVTALTDINLDIRRGEVLALLGDNGAGKSTFIKILSGAHRPSDGTIAVDGAPISFASPQDAAEVGIARSIRNWRSPRIFRSSKTFFLGGRASLEF